MLNGFGRANKKDTVLKPELECHPAPKTYIHCDLKEFFSLLRLEKKNFNDC